MLCDYLYLQSQKVHFILTLYTIGNKSISLLKKKTAVIGAFLSLLPFGQPLVTGAVFTSAAVMLSVPEKANAESAEFYINTALEKYSILNYSEALKDLNRAIKINPRNSIAYYNRGTINGKDFQEYKLAINDFDKAIEINPSYGAAYNNRGMARLKLGKKYSACLDFKKSASLGYPLAVNWIKNDRSLWCRHMREVYT